MNSHGGYWLASPSNLGTWPYEIAMYVEPYKSVYDEESDSFEFFGCLTGTNTEESPKGIRPVVYIPAGINLKIKSEGIWELDI